MMASLACYTVHSTDAEWAGFTFVDGPGNQDAAGCNWALLIGYLRNSPTATQPFTFGMRAQDERVA